MKLKKILLAAACVLALASTAPASADKPGQGVTASPARATWNTGFFQEALVRRGLEELGYTVKKPKDLANPLAYTSIALGDLDYWTNGWFPMHEAQLPGDFAAKAELVGYVAKAGGLQGYLVSKKHVEEFNIKSLDDFKRPEVIKAFDSNGDGKADLTACPAGWGCEKVIDHHMDAYGLRDFINPVKASYEAGMANAVGAYKSGKPVFFYTWTPNWTTFKFKPGVDVMWINVPGIKPSEAQKSAVDRMTVAGVEGAVSDPIELGFVVSDIRIVANSRFLNDNPAARKFFEDFTLPLADINAQNARMNEGEKSQKFIETHVDAWIAANKTTWDGWLKAARDAAK
ncbi:MAG: glycine betaine/L-proline ABC transporter substrate-binding protein ProX [Pseudodesulfovibrio sp.]|uniref:Substrate-binding region of ABC-type glycine betaine transport system n=1 Tax=Pseudodesulfovibrio aespoeensis (strain ATCC 700646 / DSM 10631 / Aspo-2) TaxID=643562 RepID=E6VZE7_PSEA9|nr:MULTISPECIES: glycine betaine/L-proline ABC transporter substrate-binding protein ProX [Pseudodesulfovibrio]MBU4190904.1 glycine betaine/L-proline ABC transporter substrate-binding protein ProX [Pseudomonadota bacterium]ADU64019.1 Substrate-binding region of ABC-type glycine betaine transport system [Pseudodesulfovibrio aespoeensis Aspo-2]MBU4245218.1 glycine betaine/L-proline ABC transporter substrate-binding protein ProX [Pseudomonadota bacterium]MBU4380196.1 glycine betaine/L-proline ABC 